MHETSRVLRAPSCALHARIPTVGISPSCPVHGRTSKKTRSPFPCGGRVHGRPEKEKAPGASRVERFLWTLPPSPALERKGRVRNRNSRGLRRGKTQSAGLRKMRLLSGWLPASEFSSWSRKLSPARSVSVDRAVAGLASSRNSLLRPRGNDASAGDSYLVGRECHASHRANCVIRRSIFPL